MRLLEKSAWEDSSATNTHHGQLLSVALTQDSGPDDLLDEENDIEIVERSRSISRERQCMCQQNLHGKFRF